MEHVPQLIHAPPPRTARHLPELIGAQGAVAREVAVVGLVELREHHGARLGRIRGWGLAARARGRVGARG